jgi:hypothetical protein
VDAICEEILLCSGLVEEAYRRYGLHASRGGTYLATFWAVARKYPHKSACELLAALVEATPGEEAKWFAAAKQAGLYDEALALARRSPCDPKTLTRAAGDFADTQPRFAVGAGLLALHWLAHGYGYEITSADVHATYAATVKAAQNCDTLDETRVCAKQLAASEGPGGFVSEVLGSELGLSCRPERPGPRIEPKRR